jgi:hypothetical protein
LLSTPRSGCSVVGGRLIEQRNRLGELGIRLDDLRPPRADTGHAEQTSNPVLAPVWAAKWLELRCVPVMICI